MSSLEVDLKNVSDNLRQQVAEGKLFDAHIVCAYADENGQSVIQVFATPNADASEISENLQNEGLNVVVDQNDHVHTLNGYTHTHEGLTHTHDHDHIHEENNVN